MAFSPWVVSLYRWYEYRISVVNVVVRITRVAWTRAYCTDKGGVISEWCDFKDGMFDLYLIYQLWIYAYHYLSLNLFKVLFW